MHSEKFLKHFSEKTFGRDILLEVYIKSPMAIFSLGDVFGQLGGFVGVFCGMSSILSIFELIVYSVLFVVRKIKRGCSSRIQL